MEEMKKKIRLMDWESLKEMENIIESTKSVIKENEYEKLTCQGKELYDMISKCNIIFDHEDIMDNVLGYNSMKIWKNSEDE